jgi:hypothetical protein
MKTSVGIRINSWGLGIGINISKSGVLRVGAELTRKPVGDSLHQLLAVPPG